MVAVVVLAAATLTRLSRALRLLKLPHPVQHLSGRLAPAR